MPASWVGNEEKWKKAKEAAEKAGRGGDYAYITGIYKQMGGEVKKMNVKKADDPISRLEALLKARSYPDGTKRTHGGRPVVKRGGKWVPVSGANKNKGSSSNKIHVNESNTEGYSPKQLEVLNQRINRELESTSLSDDDDMRANQKQRIIEKVLSTFDSELNKNRKVSKAFEDRSWINRLVKADDTYGNIYR